AINKHWFKYEATCIHSAQPGHEKTWRVDMVAWNKDNPDAFAGLHNEGKRILLVFDYSSAIHDRIYEVTEGALTDANTEIIWICFGNHTKNKGRFRECFGKRKGWWITRQIDSRDVEGTNKAQYQAWIEEYGEDSDFVRIRVKGRFPRQSSMQFISSELVY